MAWPRIVILALFASACRTAPIETVQISVPPGLVAGQVEFAILATLANAPIPLEMTQADLAVALQENYAEPPRLRWFIESKEPGIVYGGFRESNHSLTLRLQYDAQQITARVVSSNNLLQEDGRIHKNANVWVRELIPPLSKSLKQVASWTFLVGGISSAYERPRRQQRSNEARFASDFEATWNKLVRELAKSYFVINNIEEASCIINLPYS